MSKQKEFYNREIIRLQSKLKDAAKFAQLGIKENNFLKERIKQLEKRKDSLLNNIAPDNDSFVKDYVKPWFEPAPPLRERIFDQLEHEIEVCRESDEKPTENLLRLALFIYQQQNG